MPTIAAGTSASFTLAAGQTAIFAASGNGTAVLSGGQRDGTPYSIGETVTSIGPFTSAQNVSVSCDRAVSYNLVPALSTPQADSSGVIYDSLGNAIGGGGGSTTFSGLTDAASANIPATNAPTAAALAGKAPLSQNTSLQIGAAVTSATPTDATFTAFAAQACNELVVYNDTRVPVEVQRNGAGNVITVLPGQTKRFLGITDASQLAVRRSDYAVLARTQQTTVSAQANTRTDTYTLAGVISVAVNGGAFSNLTSMACTSVELFNSTGKDIIYRIGGAGNTMRLKYGRSAVIPGITNANQVSFRAADSIARQMRPLEAEAWTSGPLVPTMDGGVASFIDGGARVLLGELQYVDQIQAGSILTLGNLRNVRRLRKKGLVQLARWMTTADVVSNRAADFADVTNGEIAYGSSIVEYTQSQTAAVTIAPAAANAVGTNVSNGSIHFTHCWPDNAGNNYGVNGPTSFTIELHSAGSPSSPTANFHTSPVLNSNFQEFLRPSSGIYAWLRSYSLPISAFTASGTGATLTAITWARIVIQGGSASNGCKLRPVSIEFVPNYLTKASVIFTFDDIHLGVLTNVLPLFAKYNYPGVLFVDTNVKAGQTNFLSKSQISQLHRQYGWQAVYQVFQTETGLNLSPEEWMEQAGKAVLDFNYMGIHDTQDGSYGSGTVTNVDDERYMAAKRMFRTMTRFNSGTNTSPPFRVSETVPFGDPYSIRRLNISSGFTAGTYYARFQDHVDQAIAAKGVAIFGAHSEFNSAGEYLTALGTLVDYIRTQEVAGNLEVDTFSSLIDRAYAT